MRTTQGYVVVGGGVNPYTVCKAMIVSSLPLSSSSPISSSLPPSLPPSPLPPSLPPSPPAYMKSLVSLLVISLSHTSQGTCTTPQVIMMMKTFWSPQRDLTPLNTRKDSVHMHVHACACSNAFRSLFWWGTNFS